MSQIEVGRAQLLGMALFALVALFTAVDAVLVRLLSAEVHPFIIAFARSLFGLLVVLPWIMARPQMLKSTYRTLHIVRAGLKLAALIAFFAAFAVAPLADVTTIAFASPIFVTIGAWMFLTERPGPRRFVAVGLGFLGVMIVLNPSGGISSGLIFALIGAILTAIIQLILKPMAAHDKTDTLVAWNLLVTVPLAAALAVFVWEAPTPQQWGIMAIQGVLGAVNMGIATKAFALADASLITPVDFVRLPIVAALAYWIFGEAASMATWIGAGVIFASTLIIARSAVSRGE